MKITVNEVARRARVSLGSVSRVLSGAPDVSPEMAAKVRKAARDLGYQPLRRRAGGGRHPLQGRTLALVLLGMGQSLLRLPVIAAAIHGVEAALSEAGARLFIADVPGLDRVPEALCRGRVDGLILKSALQGDVIGRLHPGLRARIQELPSVWFLGRPAGITGDVVQADDRAVGRLAAEHLVARGHRRVAYLNPKSGHLLFGRREESFLWRARELGARARSVPAPAGDWGLPLGVVERTDAIQAMLDRLLRGPARPSAVFVPADSIAAALYRALQERGLRPGADLAVVSCNHEPPILAGLFPSLSTVDIRAEQIGRRAVDQLAVRIANPGAPPVDIGLEPALVEGASVPVLER